MKRFRRFLAGVLTMSLIAIGFVYLAPSASAAAGNILPPFDTGQQWNICQGYDGPITHSGTSQYGLDLTGAGCDNSAAGRNVQAPIGGTVAYYQTAYGNLCVNIPGGGSYTLTHINATVTSGSVTPGQAVGTVAAAGTRGNNNLAHLHFQAWGTPNCYNSSVVPFDEAHGLRICGAPNLTASGPNGGNGTWSGTTFTGQTCGNPAPGGYQGVGAATFKGSATLQAGQRLNPNEYITSDNGQSVFIMQTDGNAVLYRGSAAALWSSGTGGNPGAYLTVQTDGNIVVYSANNVPLWWTGTNGVNRITMQTDGNLVGYTASNQPQWWTGTGGAPSLTYLGTDHLSSNGQIHPNQYIRSSDGRYFLLAQADGNIVLYSPGYHVLWSTGTSSVGGAYLTVQTDGNIVVYSATNTALWSTGTNNAASLWLQNDGNAVGKDSLGSPMWMSGTYGQI